MRTVGAPHLLEVVEATHLGTENVNEHVTGVDQHPIAGRKALDARIPEPLVLEVLDDAVGDGAHMAVGAALRNDHVVCKRGFAGQVDLDRIFGLHLLEGGQGDGPDILIVRSIRSGERGKRMMFRLKRVQSVQVQTLSLSATSCAVTLR